MDLQRELTYPTLDCVQNLVDCGLVTPVRGNGQPSEHCPLVHAECKCGLCTYWPTTDHPFTQYHTSPDRSSSSPPPRLVTSRIQIYRGSIILTPSADADPNNGSLQPRLGSARGDGIW